MSKKNLIIINNERCFEKDQKVYCENIEIKSLNENLSKFFNLKFFLRRGNTKPIYEINKSNTFLSSNPLSFSKNIINSIFNDNAIYLIISVTPYTLYSFILLLISRKKVYLYLRSDGKKEISIIFGKILSNLYKIGENFISRFSNLIVVNKEISNKDKYFLVRPSQLDDDWNKNISRLNLHKEIKLLYIGRLKIEKGIFSLLNIYDKIKNKKNLKLTIIGQGKKIKNLNVNINFLGPIADKFQLIKQFDKHSILVLPSYTEGHPQVLIESLSRYRPVIIFEDIRHIKLNYNGVFVCRREPEDFQRKIDYIKNNYNEIYDNFKKNELPTKKMFFRDLSEILNQI